MRLLRPGLVILASVVAVGVSVGQDEAGEVTQARSDVHLVIGGGFTLDAVGPAQFEAVKKRVSSHGVVCNQILADEYAAPGVDVSRDSQVYYCNALRLTRSSDAEGALRVARELARGYRAALFVYDRVAEKEKLLAQLPEEDARTLSRLVQHRGSLEEFVARTAELVARVYVRERLEGAMARRKDPRRATATWRALFTGSPTVEDQGETMIGQVDPQWIPIVGDPGWLPITGDRVGLPDRTFYRRVLVTHRPTGTPDDGELVVVLLLRGGHVALAFQVRQG